MIKYITKYVYHFINETKRQFPQIDDVILKSSLVYQYLYIKNFNKIISIDEILECNEYDLGLIGPGNGYITKILERTVRWSELFHTHSILHNAFGSFYRKYEISRGYSYSLPKRFSTTKMKKILYLVI